MSTIYVCSICLRYKDYQSLYDAVHSMKQTFQEGLLVDMIERNEIEVTWIEKERQISDVLTKAGVSSRELLMC